MHQKTKDAFRSLDTVVDPAFAKDILERGPKLIANNFIQPIGVVIVGKGRERVRDAALAYIHDAMPKFAIQRIVAATDYPEELPSDAMDDVSLYNNLVREGFYSYAPEQFELPQISAMVNQAYGAQPPETKLSALIREFMRWDTDLYCILSPMDPLAWEVLAMTVMTGHAAVIGIERKDSEPVRYPSGGNFDTLPGESFPVIDIDAGKIHMSLKDAIDAEAK